MLTVARPARRGRHPGDRREQGRPAQVARPPPAGAVSSCTRPATSWRPGSTCWSASRSPRRPPRSSRATTPTPRSAPTSTSRTSSRTAHDPGGGIPPILPGPRARCSPRSRSACAAATSPARPARRCSTRRRPAQARCRSECKKTKYDGQPGLHGPQRRCPAATAARRPAGDLLGLPGLPAASSAALARATLSTQRRRRRAAPERRRALRRPVMTRGVRIRIAAFLVLSAVGIVYIAGTYLGFVDRVLGRGITVHATLPTSGGLFEGSEVTYRGVKIGKVSRDDGDRRRASPSTSRSRTAPSCPMDSPMYVHNLSAVGEQYLDFEPPDDKGPYAEDGDTLARRRGVAAGRRGRPAGRARPVRRARSTRRTSRPWSASSARCSTTPASRCSGCSTTAARSSTRRRRTPTRPIALLDHGHDGAAAPSRARARTSARFSRDLRSLTDALAEQRRGPASRSSTARPAPPASSTRCCRTSSRRCRCCSATRSASTRSWSRTSPASSSCWSTYPRTISAGFTGTPGDGYGHVNLQLDYSQPPCTAGLQAAQRVAAAERPLRRPDLPGPVHSRPAVRHARLRRTRPARPATRPRARLYRVVVRPARPASSTARSTRNGNPVRFVDQGNLSILGDDAWKWLLVGPVTSR